MLPYICIHNSASSAPYCVPMQATHTLKPAACTFHACHVQVCGWCHNRQPLWSAARPRPPPRPLLRHSCSTGLQGSIQRRRLWRLQQQCSCCYSCGWVSAAAWFWYNQYVHVQRQQRSWPGGTGSNWRQFRGGGAGWEWPLERSGWQCSCICNTCTTASTTTTTELVLRDEYVMTR